MIPNSNVKDFRFLLTDPFDWKVWTAFWTALILAGIVWKLYARMTAIDSVWRFVFGVLAYFVVQSVSIRSNRFFLMLILQTFIFAVLILGSLYQGELTASMIRPSSEEKLTTFDELFESNFSIVTSNLLHTKMMHDDAYAKIKFKVNSTGIDTGKINFAEMSRDGKALIMSCYLADFHYHYHGDASKFYYLLEERIMKHYERLDATYMNPHIDKMQLYMDWSFEAGLPYAWKIFSQISAIKKEEIDDRQFLELDDFEQTFVILAVGLLMASIAFVSEIIFARWISPILWRRKVRKMQLKEWRRRENALRLKMLAARERARLQPKIKTQSTQT